MNEARPLVQREVVDGFVWSAIPVIQVEAPGSTIALFRGRSTVCAWPSHPRGTHVSAGQVTHRFASWGVDSWSQMLTLVEPGADHWRGHPEGRR